MTSIADEYARSKRRLATWTMLLTALLTTASVWWLTLPTWRKLTCSDWPTAAAELDGVDQTSPDPKAWIFEGSQLRVRFSYASADGVERHASQKVSKSWATAHDLGSYGYVVPAGDDVMRWQPPPLTCRIDPDDPDVALLQTSLSHGDVPALLPLLVLTFGTLMVVAERRNAGRADDAAMRTYSRNATRWQISNGADALVATPKVDVSPDAMLFTAVIAWPMLSVRVEPHPLRLGEAARVTIDFSSRRRWRRRVRARLSLGAFGGRRAAWSTTIIDGQLAPDVSAGLTVALPALGDLPPGCDDAWVRVTTRTLLGLPWSRTLWLAIDDGR